MEFFNGIFGSNTMCSECNIVFNNLKEGKFDDVLKNINCHKCYKCVDDNGNTILHNLVICNMNQNLTYRDVKQNSTCREILNFLLKQTFISKILNKQNKLGETPIFIAVKNDNQYGATMLDNSGADKSIRNNKGEFIMIEDDINNIGETTLIITDIEPRKKNIEPVEKLQTIGETNSKEIVETTDFFEGLNLTSDIPMTNTDKPKEPESDIVKLSDVINPNSVFKTNEQTNQTNEQTNQTNEQTNQTNEQNSEKKQIDEKTDILNTDTLMANLQGIAEKNNTTMTGGKTVYKSHGTRKLNMHSEKSDNLKNINELSLLMNNRKNDLHKEVENIILKMLNDEKITIASKIIEASEKNALLIKSFLYNYVKNKSPQLSGMDKIMKVKEMPEHEILVILKDMPDIDKYEKQINKFKEENLKNKEEYFKSKNIVSDTSLDVDDLDTEKPDKKEKKTKDTKTSKTKDSKTKDSKTKDTKKSKASKTTKKSKK